MKIYSLQELIKEIKNLKEHNLTSTEKKQFDTLINFDYEHFIDTMETPNNKSIEFTKIFEEMIDCYDMKKVYMQSDLLTIYKSLKTNKERTFFEQTVELMTKESLAGEIIVKSTPKYALSQASTYSRLLYDYGENQNASILRYFDSIDNVDEEHRESLEYKIREIYDYQSGEYLYNYQELFIPNCGQFIKNFNQKGLIKEILDNYNLKRFIFANLDPQVMYIHKEITNEILEHNFPNNEFLENYKDISMMHYVAQMNYEGAKEKRLSYYKNTR